MSKSEMSSHESKLHGVPLAELTNPMRDGPLMPYKDRYWLVDENDNALFYGKGRSPQCNGNKQIIERLWNNRPGIKIVFVPWAWVSFNISDYTE